MKGVACNSACHTETCTIHCTVVYKLTSDTAPQHDIVMANSRSDTNDDAVTVVTYRWQFVLGPL